MTAYLVKRGGKYLHMDAKNGVFWGRMEGAFHFFSTDAAAQVVALLPTGPVLRLLRVRRSNCCQR